MASKGQTLAQVPNPKHAKSQDFCPFKIFAAALQSLIPS
jgi:hypothetical protein